jgi:hypothetical protein
MKIAERHELQAAVRTFADIPSSRLVPTVSHFYVRWDRLREGKMQRYTL